MAMPTHSAVKSLNIQHSNQDIGKIQHELAQADSL